MIIQCHSRFAIAPRLTPFVSAEQMRRTPRDEADLVPDLIVEVKSLTDRVRPLEEKIQQFLGLRTQVGMLVDPDKQTVTIYYRDDRQPVVLGNRDIITAPELLPGWKMPVSEPRLRFLREMTNGSED